MAEYLIKGETLTGIADAIRSKTGESGAIAVQNMSSTIDGISTSGVVTGTFKVTEVTTAVVICAECNFIPSRFFIHMYSDDGSGSITVPESETYSIITDLAYDGRYTYCTAFGTTGTNNVLPLHYNDNNHTYKPVYELIDEKLNVLVGLYCSDEGSVGGIGQFSFAPGTYQWIAIK